MLIELIGPAGIGKTTAARRAEDILREKGVDVLGFDELERLEGALGIRSLENEGRLARVRIAVLLLLRCPDVVLPIMLLSWLYGPEQSTGSRKQRRRRARRALGHVRMVLELKTKAADRIVLLHEGFTQVLWTLLIDSPSLRATWLISLALSRFHAVFGQKGIRFVIDDETVIRRVFARDVKGRFNRDSDDERRRDFPRWLDYHRGLVALLPSGLAETRIDGAGSYDRVAGELADVVLSTMPVADREGATPVGAVAVRSMI